MRRTLNLAVLLAMTFCFAVSARAEPLLLYTSQPDGDVRTLVEAFLENCPGVEVRVFRSGTEEVVSKVLAEKMTGRVQADLLLLADAVTFERLKAEGVLAVYRSPEASALPDSVQDPDGTYCGTKVLATVLLFNTSAGKAVEPTWKALLDPENADRAMIASPLYSGAAAYQLGVLTRSEGFGWEFYEGMKANAVAVGKGNGSIITAVAGGDRLFGPVVDYMARRAKAKGSPVDYVYPAEGSPVITEPVGIVAREEVRDEAKRFVDFLLSEKGQALFSGMGYVPVRRGVPVPDGLLGIDQVTVLSADSAMLIREREGDKARFSELFGY